MPYNKNKISQPGFFLLGCILYGLFFINLANATSLDFPDISNSLQNHYTSIDFSVGDGSIGGIFWTQTQSFSSGNYQQISINGAPITCKEQIRGIYYNAMRGSSVLRPLDPWTLDNFRQMDDNYNDVGVKNGFFTSCYSGTEIESENYLGGSIYGQIKFTGSQAQATGSLIAGVEYNKGDNEANDKRAKSLSYLSNTPVPIGYVYDTHGSGIGFVGGMLSGDNTKDQNHQNVLTDINNGSSINNIFDTQTDPDKLVWLANGNTGSIQEDSNLLKNIRTAAKNNLMKIGLAGNAMASKGSMSTEITKSLVENMQGGKKQTSTIISSNKMNVGDVINQANKSANMLCNGSYEEKTDIDFANLGSINCIKASDNIVTIDRSWNSPSGNRKTIIAKEGTNILFSGSMTQDYLDIFIQRGNLYVKNATGSLQDFDESGQLSNTDNGGMAVTSGMNLNGNIVVNGLIAGYSGGNANNSYIGSFSHKLYIHGKVASLNSIKEPPKSRKRMMKRRFDSWFLDSKRDIYKKYINLENGFSWRCQSAIGKGTDGVNCEKAGEYGNKSIIFIPNRYESQILK